MANDVEIRVQVSNQTAGGLASVNQSIRDLRNNARDAAQSLNRLTTAATAAAAALQLVDSRAGAASRSLRDLGTDANGAAAALRDLRDSGTGVNNSLRTLNARTQTAGGRLESLSNRTQALRDDTNDLGDSVERLVGRFGGLRSGLGSLPGITVRGGDGMQRLKAAAIALSPALIPIAAAAVPVAGGLLAATAAVGVFGLALGGQVAKLMAASEAQKKYREAVKEHGKASEEAAKAEAEYLRAVQAMPAPTRRAAAALGIMKDQYKDWSNALSSDTMPVVTKSFANFGALLPRLTPTVRGASVELDRLMTVMGGGIQSAGFERFMDSFAQFASGALRKATDGLISFSRAMSEGAGRSEMAEFMAYAREQGPLVGETLRNLAKAMTHLVVAASDVGVGILQVVNALAKLVNALPSEAISTLLQFALAFKAVKLAAAGLAAAGGGLGVMATRITAMRTAAAGATGTMAGLSAAMGTLSRSAKVTLAATGIGILAVGLVQLSKVGREAPPNVDRLTTSLGNLGRGGRAAGELAKHFGRDLGELYSQIRSVTDPSTTDKIQQGLVKVFSLGMADSTPAKEAKANLDAIDKGLTNLVRGGKAELAASALERLKKAYAADGKDPKQLTRGLDDYKAALADMRFEEELAAEAQGLFGQQALDTQRALSAQKQSADGLRQSLVALNETQRAGLGGMNAFEQAVDDTAKAAKENRGALRMVGGELDLNSQKARDADTALRDLAQKTDEAATAARDSGASWGKVNGIYDRGRSKLIEYAHEMGLTKGQARQLANEILGIKGLKKVRIEMEKEDAVKGLREVKAAINRTPGAKKVTVSTLNKRAIAALEAVGLKTKRLPNGRTEVFTKNGQSLGSIGAVQRALANIPRTINTTVTTTYQIRGHKSIPSGTYYGSTAGRSADGNIYGRARSYADGGMEQHVAQIAQPTYRMWAEPETGGEAYIPLSEAKRPRSLAILDEVADRFGYRLEEMANGGVLSFARGGTTKAERSARRSIDSKFTVGSFSRKAGRSLDSFERALARPDDVSGLISSLREWSGMIKKAAHGGTERRLLRGLDRMGGSLIKQQKNLEKVNDQLSKAKDKLSDLRQSASQLRDSVKGGITSSANITGVMEQTNGRIPTAGLIMSQLQTDRDKSAQLASALATLKKRGVDKRFISEIAEAGIEGGGLETARGLLTADKDQIKRMNSLRDQIASNAGKVGDVARDAMYGAGLKAAEGLVKGLQKKQDAIEKQMLKIARAMEKSIKRALGIRSPSKVTEGIGDMTAEGFALGVERNRRVPRAWQSLLAAPAAPRAVSAMPAARRGGDGAMAPIIVHQTITLDGKVIARETFEPLQGEIRRHGGDPNVLTKKVVFR